MLQKPETLHKESIAAARLLSDVYGEDFSQEIIDAKYFGNPDRVPEPISFLYDGEDGVPVCMGALVGMRVIEGADPDTPGSGRIHSIAQISDVATVQSYQGKGGFSRIVRSWTGPAANAEASSGNLSTDTAGHVDGAEFLIGLPNENSEPRLKHLGYREIVWLNHYLRIEHPARLLTGSNPLSSLIDCIWNIPGKISSVISGITRPSVVPVDSIKPGVSDTPDFDGEDYELINHSCPCRFLRSEAYFEWKRSYNRDIRFRFITLRSRTDNALYAYIVYHIRPMRRGGVLVIDDWSLTRDLYSLTGHTVHDNSADSRSVNGQLNNRDKSSSLETALQAEALELMLCSVPDKYDIVQFPLVNPSLPEARILRRMGFFNSCRPPVNSRGGHLIVSEGAPSFLEKCAFRQLDSDVIT